MIRNDTQCPILTPTGSLSRLVSKSKTSQAAINHHMVHTNHPLSAQRNRGPGYEDFTFDQMDRFHERTAP